MKKPEQYRAPDSADIPESYGVSHEAWVFDPSRQMGEKIAHVSLQQKYSDGGILIPAFIGLRKSTDGTVSAMLHQRSMRASEQIAGQNPEAIVAQLERKRRIFTDGLQAVLVEAFAYVRAAA